ncbi:MAG: hypothetical protein JNK82_27025, partial [Myxococcaceae bacterium]|nr:hypothetical protein [Myxococcaceae bacterium]
MSWLVLAAVLTAEPEPELPLDPVEVSFGVPALLGGTVAPSVNGVAGRFSMGVRPAVSVNFTRAAGLGVGAYGLAATLRSFSDFAGGGGLELTVPWPFRVRPVVSGGVLATVDARGAQPCFEAGLYYGAHSVQGVMAIFGLRADARV